MARVLVTADDCTGALEVAGALADRAGRSVPAVVGRRLGWRVAPPRGDDAVLVVDLSSRHTSAAVAADRVAEAIGSHAPDIVAHKFDSTLRGNWADEVLAAGRASGRPVLVVPALPAAGRTCRNGIVSVDGVPVEHTAAGRDPRQPVRSSRPADHLHAAGASDVAQLTTVDELAAWFDRATPSVAVVDAASADDLERIGERWRASGRRSVFAGTAGSVSAGVAEPRAVVAEPLPPPAVEAVLVVCGSLHPGARRQVAELMTSADPADRIAVATSLPPWPPGTGVHDDAAESAAVELASRAHRALVERRDRAVVVIGGDTAAALLDGERLEVQGTIEVGTPWCRREHDARVVVTRSGGFGDAAALCRLVGRLLTGAVVDDRGERPFHGRMGA